MSSYAKAAIELGHAMEHATNAHLELMHATPQRPDDEAWRVALASATRSLRECAQWAERRYRASEAAATD